MNPENKISRRDFIKASAVTGAAAAISGGTGIPIVSAEEAGDEPKLNKKYGMVIDLRRCTGCRACQIACKAENEVPLGVFRTWVDYNEKGNFPDTKLHFLPRLCNHCNKPKCLAACPLNAIYKRDDGIVVVDYDKCKNIKNCIKDCPYGMVFTNPVRVTAGKCTLCHHRVDKGIEPACVMTCQGRARIFGDLDDPNSKASKLIRENPAIPLMPDEGTEPNIFYIAANSDAVSKSNLQSKTEFKNNKTKYEALDQKIDREWDGKYYKE